MATGAHPLAARHCQRQPGDRRRLGTPTFQRLWRDRLSRALIEKWLAKRRYQRIGFANGQRQNAEYRITEDARLATDAPIDLVVGLLSSLLTAGTFVTVLWEVGGSLEIVGLILCAPNYVLGTVTLGEVTQAAAAFVAVQGAFNWLVDNFPRLAEWLSSANRVGMLLNAFDRLDSDESGAPT